MAGSPGYGGRSSGRSDPNGSTREDNDVELIPSSQNHSHRRESAVVCPRTNEGAGKNRFSGDISVLEKVMTPVPLPEISEANCTSAYDHRVLFLSGTWERTGNEFRLRATIMVGKDGSADGSIYWQAARVHGQAAHYFATEWVHGFVRGRDVELDGYEVALGLSPDSYRITLSGDGEAGTFGEITRTPLNNWGGRINGQYLFRNRKA
jgi:hypothetical protein